MKKFLSLLLALTMLLTLCGAASAEAGVFTGVGDSDIGGKGAIEVAVTVDENGAVTAIEVTKNGDTAGISDPAVAQIPGLIVEQQTANVDAVAGATKTSDAIMAAVLDAVTKAGLDTVKWSTKVETVAEKAEDVTIETEIVVIGGGGAGLAAAVQANQLGSKVLVLEKMGKVGGNTILAGGALNAVNDRSEQAIAYNDSVEWHYTQTLSGGDYQGDPLLVHTLVSNAWDGVQWLMDLGMEFQDETAGLFTVTGGLWPRAHKPVEPLGTGFFKAYMNYIDSHDNVDVMLNTRATEILVDENGKILHKDSVPTLLERGPEPIIKDMANLSLKVVKDAGYTLDDVKAVGVGVPGLADPKTGVVIFCTNLRWHMVPLREIMQSIIDKPIFIDNDATVAGLAESVAGVSAGVANSVFLTLGTGVGGGIVINHKIYSGSHGVGSELGHMTVQCEGRPCTCGSIGCWEQYSSATALIRQGREAVEKNPDSLIVKMVNGDLSKIEARTVIDAARDHGYEVVQIADHGNADNAVNADGSPNTAHSLNPVPILIVSDRVERVENGVLADVATTVLTLMGLPIPPEMTGRVLVTMR